MDRQTNCPNGHSYDKMLGECPQCPSEEWEPGEPDGLCELCPYRATAEWALLPEIDRDFIKDFMRFLIANKVINQAPDTVGDKS